MAVARYRPCNAGLIFFSIFGGIHAACMCLKMLGILLACSRIGLASTLWCVSAQAEQKVYSAVGKQVCVPGNMSLTHRSLQAQDSHDSVIFPQQCMPHICALMIFVKVHKMASFNHMFRCSNSKLVCAGKEEKESYGQPEACGGWLRGSSGRGDSSEKGARAGSGLGTSSRQQVISASLGHRAHLKSVTSA